MGTKSTLLNLIRYGCNNSVMTRAHNVDTDMNEVEEMENNGQFM
uniref:Uncharacterized protein n=1 Tax=Arundo donax TaxID=35708 RepID=A0A0A9BS55_ARUDO